MSCFRKGTSKNNQNVFRTGLNYDKRLEEENERRLLHEDKIEDKIS